MSSRRPWEDLAGSGRLNRERRRVNFDFAVNLSRNADVTPKTPDLQRRRSPRTLAASADSVRADFFEPEEYMRREFSRYLKPRTPSPEVFPNHKVIRMYRLNPDGSFIYSSSSEESDEEEDEEIPRKKESQFKNEKKTKKESDAKIDKKREKLSLPTLELQKDAIGCYT